ncbi:unnamed protein product [Mytilus coruscus]|uniref:Uncharacterized protein n=1 Tax=Mytilus coruscus TaxID=42192 RepID=A0A6J8ADI9_MYTCO|nr:unnamed protein product [Mytilus coruscus]
MIGSNRWWSPDSTKELWCPDECYTKYYHTDEIDQCCSCKSFPEWQQTDMFSNISYILLDIEIADAQGKHSHLAIQKSLPPVHIYFGVKHENGLLRRLPRNICDFGIVSVDFTGNRFNELGNDSNIVCGALTANNSSLSDNPISYISKRIDMKAIVRFFPCGDYRFYGSSYNCDCNLGLFLDVTLDVFQRIYKKRHKESFCNSPEPLVNISIQDAWVNDSYRNMMKCDVIDNCTKTRDCHCQCTMQPSKRGLLWIARIKTVHVFPILFQNLDITTIWF